jgi:hypothetical protein
MQQIRTSAFQLPRRLHRLYLHRLTELLPPNFGDADVWRAARQAAREVTGRPEIMPRRGA